jgi:RimJ/RimL family protein N-acetyltransferase
MLRLVDALVPLVLETARLVLRQVRIEDLDPFARMMSDPEVRRYLDGRVIDRDEAWREMALWAGHWSLRGYGLWAAEVQETGTFVGRIGLYNPEGWPGLEVGWALAREHWGKGYATEGARAALECAFDLLGAEHVISVIHPDNARSIRVAERLGQSFERRARVRGVDTVIFGRHRSASGPPTGAGQSAKPGVAREGPSSSRSGTVLSQSRARPARFENGPGDSSARPL